MTDKAAAAAKGLQNVIVGQTRLSLVNGAEGKLIYVGYKIEDLAEHACFEEVIYLLWHGELPNRQQLDAMRQALYAEMHLPAAVMGMLYAFPKDATPMAVLRTAVSMLALYDPKADDNSVEENRRKALQLTAKAPVIVAAWERARHGKEPIPARQDYSFAENFLWMLKA
ncbi:MAG: citrate synthase, partial [Chloroflexi bacterium]|nr:citrate synthase [Chloroflexota bacterium]